MSTPLVMDAEPVSLWGILHDGKLVRVLTDRNEKTVAFDFVVEEFNVFQKWKPGSVLHFELGGVHGVKAEQWKPEPNHGDGVIRSRRGFSIDWRTLEHRLPPLWVRVSEATAQISHREANFSVSGLKQGDQSSNDDLIELSVLAESLTVYTPDGTLALERLLHLGDSFWDHLTKRKSG